MRRSIKILVALALAGVLCAIYVRTHPLIFNESFAGHAHCISGTGLSLLTYAEENGGRFPFHTNGYGDALLLLTNEMAGFWAGFTGPGYDGKVFAEAARTGRHIPEEACGRVYVQGLSRTNDPEIALLFDKLPTPGGDHCNGLARLRAPLGREVWIVGGGIKWIHETEWPQFARGQVQLLVKAGMSRREAEGLYATQSK